MDTARKAMARTVLFLVLIAITPAAYSQALKNSIQTPPAGALVEEFSFLLKDFRMDHQGQENNLNIAVSYRYVSNIFKADYPDFRSLAKDIEMLLASYPQRR